MTLRVCVHVDLVFAQGVRQGSSGHFRRFRKSRNRPEGQVFPVQKQQRHRPASAAQSVQAHRPGNLLRSIVRHFPLSCPLYSSNLVTTWTLPRTRDMQQTIARFQVGVSDLVRIARTGVLRDGGRLEAMPRSLPACYSLFVDAVPLSMHITCNRCCLLSRVGTAQILADICTGLSFSPVHSCDARSSRHVVLWKE